MINVRIRQDEFYGGIESRTDAFKLVELVEQMEHIGLEVTDVDIKVKRREEDGVPAVEG